MRTRAAAVIGIGAAAAAALWWLLRSKSSGPATTGSATSAPLNTGAWGATTSALQDPLTGIGDSIMNVVQPRGIRDNNPLNLRYIADPARAWNGQVGNDGGYAKYASPALGVRAGSRQLQEDFARGDKTLQALITTWAPPSENDTAAYINDVANRTGLDPSATLDLYAELPNIVPAMIWHENGQQPYSQADLTKWVYL